MSQDEFTKLFTYMQAEFKKVNDRLEQTATKEELNRLTNTVDGLAGLIKDYQQEMLMLAHKVDRLERWISQIAAKTGVKLEY
jgi:polyhydroxyalkanoate synthesis regulator phasin